MAEQQKQITLRDVSHGYFDEAKFWWAISLTCKLVSPILGATLIVLKLLPEWAPLIALTLALTAELCAWRSDALKGIAEGLLRQLDLHDSFGWEITPEDAVDVLAGLSTRRQAAFLAREVARDYFDSKEAQGPSRALQNLKESAWWSKQLARRMGGITLVATGFAPLGTFLVLLIAIQTIKDLTLISNISRFVIASLLAFLSVGVARLTWNSYSFGVKAETFENRAKSLLERGQVSDVEAVKLWQEYHLARGAAPMWPTLLWRLCRGRLNQLRQAYQRPKPADPKEEG